jgi:hypothetical protein
MGDGSSVHSPQKINVKIHGHSFLCTKSTQQSSDESSDLQQSLDTQNYYPQIVGTNENSFQQSLYLNNTPAECTFHRRATSALGKIPPFWLRPGAGLQPPEGDDSFTQHI